jgi:cytochrome bd-type quinol oxidase subunit 1
VFVSAAQTVYDYLLQARQMQALSFMVHIPLVSFGIAFPSMVLFVEWRYLRTNVTEIVALSIVACVP